MEDCPGRFLIGRLQPERRKGQLIILQETNEVLTASPPDRGTRFSNLLISCRRLIRLVNSEKILLQGLCRLIVETGQFRCAMFTFVDSLVKETAYPPNSVPLDLSLSLPLVNGKRIFGEMIIASDEPAAFDSQEVVVLTDLARQVANAILRLRGIPIAGDKVPERSRRQAHPPGSSADQPGPDRGGNKPPPPGDIARALTTARTPGEAAQLSLRRLRGLVRYGLGSISLIDLHKGEAALIAMEPVYRKPPLPGTAAPLLPEAVRKMKRGELFVVDHVGRSGGGPTSSDRLLLSKGWKSYACLPLRKQGELIGAITLVADRPSFFIEGHLRMAKKIAASLADSLAQWIE